MEVFLLEQRGEKGTDEETASPDPEDGRFEDAEQHLLLLESCQEADVGGYRHWERYACQDHHGCCVDVEGAPEEFIFTQPAITT